MHLNFFKMHRCCTDFEKATNAYVNCCLFPSRKLLQITYSNINILVVVDFILFIYLFFACGDLILKGMKYC